MNQEEMFEELWGILGEEPVEETTAVLAYEAAHVLEHTMHMKWSKVRSLMDEKDFKIHRAYAKSELADVLVQAKIVARKLGCTLDELLELGTEKALARLEGESKA